MTESDFIESIDCNFPYDDLDFASQLISEAGEVSRNSVYMVLHELLRAPPNVSRETKELLYNMWLTEYEQDSLFYLVRRCLPAYLKNEWVPVEITIQLMERLKEQPGQYNLLGLIYFACADLEGDAKLAFQAVLQCWE